jgi:hypothetical protein
MAIPANTRLILIFSVILIIIIVLAGCTSAPALPASHKTSKPQKCLSCHGTGEGASNIPTSHAKYTDANEGAKCLNCHK